MYSLLLNYYGGGLNYYAAKVLLKASLPVRVDRLPGIRSVIQSAVYIGGVTVAC